MQIINSNLLPKSCDAEHSNWIYNGLDCAATLISWQNMIMQTTSAAEGSYSFVSGMRAPALEMMMRGIKIDMEQRSRFLEEYGQKSITLQSHLDSFAYAIWGKGLNSNSPKQMKEILYDTMGFPPQYKRGKGERKLSTDRDALEKLSFHFYAQPIVNTVLGAREVDKKLSFLRAGIDEDFRCRTSFNVVGTETGRWSSSENAFATGTNVQNITDELRRMFISDQGYKLGYFDKDQAESRAVAYISGDQGYINACESGDLHTAVCRMVWPRLAWTGDLTHDREIADQPFYRWFSYRDMAKRGGHGTNYYGTPFTMAKHLKVEPDLMKNFQEAYFAAFPGIRRWHQRVATQVQTQGHMTTILGRKRNFLGRRFDDATLREAIAFEPQSIVGELLNLFLWRVWKADIVQCLAQIHDAILVQYPISQETEIVSKLKTLGETKVVFPSGTMVIPISAQTGFNWAKESKENPNGLKKYRGVDERVQPANKGILDWEVH